MVASAAAAGDRKHCHWDKDVLHRSSGGDILFLSLSARYNDLQFGCHADYDQMMSEFFARGLTPNCAIGSKPLVKVFKSDLRDAEGVHQNPSFFDRIF